MTDHRAEAEKWLQYAKDDDSESWLPNIVDALIGIGHALLARQTEPTPHEWGINGLTDKERDDFLAALSESSDAHPHRPHVG